jgi:YihY family inner membrane protein
MLANFPMSILALIVLSQFIGEDQLFHILSTYMEMLIPGYATTLTEQVLEFLKLRKVIGLIGFLVMLFFSSITFSMLENAMSVIFFQRVRIRRRNFFISAVIPYVYIILMGLGIALVSFIAGAIEPLEIRQLTILGRGLGLGSASAVVLHILGIIGEVFMLTSIYLVMPPARVRFRHALIGGVTATVLWEISRRILVWYYSVLSMVNLIYGSLATVVVALLTIEAGALILLLGAQVIAELERRTDEGSGEKLSGFET